MTVRQLKCSKNYQKLCSTLLNSENRQWPKKTQLSGVLTSKQWRKMTGTCLTVTQEEWASSTIRRNKKEIKRHLFLERENWRILFHELFSSSWNKTEYPKEGRSSRNSHLKVHTKRWSNISSETKMHCTTFQKQPPELFYKKRCF